MNWPLSIFAGFLTALAGLFAAGWATSLHASWHQLPNREGSVGYLIVFSALLGGIASLVAGLIVSRVVASGTDPGFFKALAWGLGLVGGITGLALLLSRVTADIPPTLESHRLSLEVEFRLPVGFSPPPAERTGDPGFGLGSISGGTQRSYQTGRLQLDQSRLEEGRWIVPASVDLFSSRGGRSIDARIGDLSLGRFIVPLPSHPGKEHESWSGWKPEPHPGNSPWPETETSFRFRVQQIRPATQP